MAARTRYRVLEFGGALRGVKAKEMEALLNDAAADGWDLQQVIRRDNSNRFLAVFRKRQEREPEEKLKRDDNWIRDWGFN